MDEFGLEVAPRAFRDVIFKVVRDLLMGFHAPERLGPPGITPAILLWGPFQDAHGRALLVCGQRRAHPGNAVPYDDDIESMAFDGHEALPAKGRPSGERGATDGRQSL